MLVFYLIGYLKSLDSKITLTNYLNYGKFVLFNCIFSSATMTVTDIERRDRTRMALESLK